MQYDDMSQSAVLAAAEEAEGLGPASIRARCVLTPRTGFLPDVPHDRWLNETGVCGSENWIRHEGEAPVSLHVDISVLLRREYDTVVVTDGHSHYLGTFVCFRETIAISEYHELLS
jgi:hypothetical protein